MQDGKKRFVLLLFAGAMLLGTARPEIVWIAFAIGAALVLLSRHGDALLLLSFLLPFATIFKINPAGSSFYTYLVLLYAVRLTAEYRAIPVRILFFSLYAVCFPLVTGNVGGYLWLSLIKLLANLVVLYHVMMHLEEYDIASVMLAFVAAMVISPLYKFLDSDLFHVSRLVLTEINGKIVRFSGLWNDPNFFSSNLILALCLLVLLEHRQKLSGTAMVLLSVPLLCYGVLTFSKSFFLMLFVWGGLLLYAGWIHGRFFRLLAAAYGGLLLIGYLMFVGDVPLFHTVLGRFNGMRGSALNNLTTGRVAIWRDCMEAILGNPLRFFFGFGIYTDSATHNTYLQLLYHFGLVGLTMFGWVLSEYIVWPRRKMSASVAGCLGLMYVFLHEAFTPELLFHLLFSAAALREMGVPDLAEGTAV